MFSHINATQVGPAFDFTLQSQANTHSATGNINVQNDRSDDLIERVKLYIGGSGRESQATDVIRQTKTFSICKCTCI